MARPSSRDPIEPMDLANMRQNGGRSLDVQCWRCRHRTIINADHWPADLPVKSSEPRMVCTKCGTVGADVRPRVQQAAASPLCGHSRSRLSPRCLQANAPYKKARE
jgi:ribosomal protein S27E